MNTDGRPRNPQSWEHLLEKDPHGGSRFRIGILAAVLIHAGIFAMTWPTIAQAPPEEPEQVLIPLQLANLAPPEPEPELIRIEVPQPPKDPPIIAGPPVEPVEPIERPLTKSTEISDGPVEIIRVPIVLEPPPEVVVRKTVVVGVDIAPPTITHRVEPRYTEPARRAGITGPVILDLIIDTKGRVESVKVLRGLPLGLTKSAVAAVEQWRFEPSTYKDRPVSVRYILTVHFNLR